MKHAGIASTLSLTLILLTACQPAPTAKTTMEAQAVQPPPQTTTPEYRVQEGDTLDLKYYYTPELNSEQVVRYDGKISLTYLGDVDVSQLTVAALHDKLVTAYASILNNPVITVSVVQSSGGRVFVGGEVNKPGEIALVGRSSVVQMLLKAGGLKPSAAGGKIVLIRRDAAGTEERMHVNADAVLAGRDMTQDIRLMPYDIVYVPLSTIAKIDQAADQYVHQLVPVQFVAQHGNSEAARATVANGPTTTPTPPPTTTPSP